MSDQVNLFGFSDAARRISDAANQALLNGARDEWLAFALSDGRVEGMPDNPRTYPRRRIAVAAQGHDARNFGYLQVPWDGVTPRAAQVMLKLARQLHDINHDLVDPEVADSEFVPSNLREHFPGDARRVLRHTRLVDDTERRRHERRSPGGLIVP